MEGASTTSQSSHSTTQTTTIKKQLKHFTNKLSLELGSQPYSLAFNPIKQQLFAGLSSGQIKNVDINSGLVKQSFIPSQNLGACSSISLANSSVKNLMLATYSGGSVLLWHHSSKKVLNQFKLDTSLNQCRISPHNSLYAVSACDGNVYLGDLQKRKAELLPTQHSNRVFSLCFDAFQPSLLYSSSWDKTLSCWDLRVKNRVWLKYGAMCVGNSISTTKEHIIAGNFQDKQRIQILSREGIQLDMIDWQGQNCRISNCCVSSDQSRIFCSVTKCNQLRMYQQHDLVESIHQQEQIVDMISHQKQSVIAYSLKSGMVKIMKWHY